MRIDTPPSQSTATVRLDKWLIAARIFKTRPLAQEACDGGHVTVNERPAVPARAVKVGDLVTFQSQATDATSGVGAQSAWTWGDNTAGGGGASATHTFTQAGTYEVKLTVADNAKITLDGKEAKLADVKVGSKVAVQLGENKQVTAISTPVK